MVFHGKDELRRTSKNSNPNLKYQLQIVQF